MDPRSDGIVASCTGLWALSRSTSRSLHDEIHQYNLPSIFEGFIVSSLGVWKAEGDCKRIGRPGGWDA